MNKLILATLIFTTVITVEKYDYSTKAAVSLGGGIVAAQSVVINKKYKRKDCPICKGKGWYISGDGIKKVDCGYCEPENSALIVEEPKSVLVPPKTNVKPDCVTGNCPAPKVKK